MGYCANCDTHRKELLKTAYGDYICEDCWDEYINSDRGLIEYFIAICNEDYSLEEFDADFLCSVIRAWNEYSNDVYLTGQDIYELEKKAREIGLL
jgi:SRSO17 transposase